ncbi:MAG TPA: CpsB/CapC family capsule biosynthesis tyrosine phosphatase [Acidobacteriota bacterium]|nr:CpsB/CapC family capsule biosynthesis tyrosine phosphatase [Acidobacteriota bacterium]
MRLLDYFKEERNDERPQYGFVDLHGHLIPGVDDGPRDFSESLDLLRDAHRSGTRWALATPHAFTRKWGMADPQAVIEVFQRFRQRLQETRHRFRCRFLDSFQIGPGAENKVCSGFLRAVKQGRVMTLNNSRYILTEFSTYEDENQVFETLDAILRKGLIPLLAHPERQVRRTRCGPCFNRLARQGGCFLINASSLDGSFGPRARWNGLEVLGDLPDSCMLASDGHRPATRPLMLLKAWRSLSRDFPGEQVKKWTHTFPHRVLGNQDLLDGKALEALPDSFPQTDPYG